MKPLPLALTALLAAASPVAAAEHLVVLSGSEFEPGRLTARVGDTIRFRNDDVVDHTVFIPTVGHGVDLGVTKSGQSTILTLRAPGRVEVECVQHGHMLMVVQIEVLP
ncbi:MAG: amicyanin [Alphaproteobacteria bacterium]|nr:MAG: amicyanin [Alphaproteobacteria bacterium]